MNYTFTFTDGPLKGRTFHNMPLADGQIDGPPELHHQTRQDKGAEGHMRAQGLYRLERRKLPPKTEPLLEGEPPPPDFEIVPVHVPSEQDQEFTRLPEPVVEEPVVKSRPPKTPEAVVEEYRKLMKTAPSAAKKLRPRYIEHMKKLGAKNPEELLDGPDPNLL